jgi:hypothetical protein
MTARFFRRLALAAVFVAGIASIMATSPPPRPNHFREVEVRPSYRCPGEDVIISWELSKPAPVTVLAGEAEIARSSEDGVTLPSALLNRQGTAAALSLRIDAEDADWPRSYKITTLDGPQTVEELAFHIRGVEFKMHRQGIWNERARAVAIGIGQVRSLRCADGAVSPRAWEVVPPVGPTFELSAKQGFSGLLEPPPPAGGEWRFRARGGDCRMPSSGMEPYLTIRLTAVCVAVGGAF